MSRGRVCPGEQLLLLDLCHLVGGLGGRMNGSRPAQASNGLEQSRRSVAHAPSSPKVIWKKKIK